MKGVTCVTPCVYEGILKAVVMTVRSIVTRCPLNTEHAESRCRATSRLSISTAGSEMRLPLVLQYNLTARLFSIFIVDSVCYLLISCQLL